MKPIQVRIAWMLSLTLCLFLPSLMTAQSASAVPSPLSVPLYAHQVFSHPDGSLTAAECYTLPQAYSSQRIVTVDPSGNTLTSLAKPTGSSVWAAQNCSDQMVVGYDSTIYVVESKSVGTSYTDYRIAAYKRGVLLWTSPAPQVCPSYQRIGVPKWLTLGYDGNLYAVMSATDCSTPDKVVGINTSSGSELFSPISFTENVSNIVSWKPRISAYADGLVMLDNNTLKYFTKTGQSDKTSYTLPLTSGESFSDATFGADGKATIPVTKTGQSCTGIYRVITHAPSGGDTSFSTAAACPKPGTIRAMPDGGILFNHVTQYDNRLMRYDAAGTLVYNTDILTMSGYSSVWVAWPQVDANGTVVVVRSGINNSNDRHTLVSSVSSNGTMQPAWDTLSLNTAASGEIFRYTQGERFAMESGSVYIPICTGTCSASNTVKIYKIAISGLGYDYPRSSWISAQPTQLNYVALGDSFSSGEGVPPFMAPSDTNGCHRSTQAYAMLLDKDPSLSLNLRSFRACSGANTQELNDGKNGESGQLDAITASTDIVTLTIGGNNIGFVDFGVACVTPLISIHCDGAARDDSLDKINNSLPGQFDALLDAIRARLVAVGNTEARILIIGYPRMMPYDDGTWPNCQLLSQEERVAAREVITALNLMIASKVSSHGYPFEFVDADIVLDYIRISPFADHELCSVDGYFNGVIPIPKEYSFHPNKNGQEAYATLVKLAILNPHA